MENEVKNAIYPVVAQVFWEALDCLEYVILPKFLDNSKVSLRLLATEDCILVDGLCHSIFWWESQMVSS